jgi:hypothetical protein
MALPKIDTPVYELDLPLSKKHITFRPFLVKEQRNLLMALEADDSETVEQNIRQVLINCTITENIDFDSLPILDIEYYFLQLRARSVGEVVQNRYKCNNEVTKDDGAVKECGNIMDVDINILDIKMNMPKDIKDEINITDKITVKLKYPQFSFVKRAKNIESATNLAFDMVAESIESIYDGEQFYYAKETDPAELIEFVESLSQEQFAKLEEFFNNLPTLNKKVEMTCTKCGFNHSLDVEGLESFFG